MNKKQNYILGFGIALLLAIVLVNTLVLDKPQVSEYKYTEIVSLFQNGHVQEYTLDLNSNELHITKLKDEPADIIYRVPDAGFFIRDVEPYIIQYNEENPKQIIIGEVLPAKSMPWWVSLLPMLLFVVIFLAFFVFMMRQMRGGSGGAMEFGKIKPASMRGTRKVTFADVAGADEEKQELVEVVEFLDNPGKFTKLGARIPKGVLLVGPPGTGKTLLARAVAGEANVEFFSISGSDFVEMFVGVGASRVRDLFAQAKKNAPSVVFIDEIDAIGRRRNAGVGGGHEEREQTLNQLLVEMDGFHTNTGVIIIAATNRSDVLDPALLRAGRFDRQVTVGYPDLKGREEILKIHVKDKPLAPDVDLTTIARTTVGFTGADLENLLNEAALLAARRDLKAITMVEIKESTIKVIAGPEKTSKVVTEQERKLTAYHEAGHAVVSYHCPTQDAVHQISIIPRGSAGGYTLNLSETDKNYRTKTEMFEDVVVAMGGRAAEQIILDDISTGAVSDLRHASRIVRNMVTEYGFSNTVGHVVYPTDQNGFGLETKPYSEKVTAEIDSEVKAWIEQAYTKAMEILTSHHDQLELVAQTLLEFEKIEADEFQNLMKYGTMKQPQEW